MKTPKPCPLDGPDLLYFFDLLSQRDRWGYRSLVPHERRRFQASWRSLRPWVQNVENDERQRECIADRLCRSKWRNARDVGGAELAFIVAMRRQNQAGALRCEGKR